MRLGASLLAALLLGTGTAEALDEWRTKRYGYVAQQQSLRSLLYDFGTTLEVPVIVSSKIAAIADGRIDVMAAEAFLGEVHTRFGVLWVYDGAVLYLYDRAENARESVAFPFEARERMRTEMNTAGVRGAPISMRFVPNEDLLQISGPPRFVEWARQTAEEIASKARAESAALMTNAAHAPAPEDVPAPSEDTPGTTNARTPLPAPASIPAIAPLAIRIFEVKYAYVDETANAASNDRGAPVGIAQTVAKLMNVAHLPTIVTPNPKPTHAGDADKAPETPEHRTRTVARRAPGEEAFVIGDARLNIVIVRDRADRMDTYERLINALDAPVDQVEMSVSVLDIDASSAQELRFALESDAIRIDANEGQLGLSTSLWDAKGITLRIRALRSAGKSRILTQPSITTLDNHEASFQNNRSFYVRLGKSENESAELASVSYGWMVRIRPHVIRDGTEARVQLSVHIEDGTRGGAETAVTGVPEVAQNVIRTQAIVPEGSALLIGGYTVREQTRFEQKIPVLGTIPVIGRLFSSNVERDQSVARYFLITPRILPNTVSYTFNAGFEGAEPADVRAIRREVRKGQIKRPLHMDVDAAEQIRAASALRH